MEARDAPRPPAPTPVVKRVATLVVAGWVLLSASCTGAAQPGSEPSVPPTGASTTPSSSASAQPTMKQPQRRSTRVALVTAELGKPEPPASRGLHAHPDRAGRHRLRHQQRYVVRC